MVLNVYYSIVISIHYILVYNYYLKQCLFPPCEITSCDFIFVTLFLVTLFLISYILINSSNLVSTFKPYMFSTVCILNNSYY